MEFTAEHLAHFLEPSSVVLVGASPDKSRLPGHLTDVLIRQGYPGRVIAVNPKYSDLEGIPCFPDVLSLPEPVDLAVILLPAAMVPGVLEQCGRRVIRSALVISSGFAEAGPAGAELQEQLVRVARQYGIRVIGPNCLGVIHLAHPFLPTIALIQDRYQLLRGPAALVTQSGFVGTSLLSYASKLGTGVDCLIPLGNEAVIQFADVVAALGQRPGIKVIAGYLEGVKDVDRFRRLVPEVTRRGTPVVVIKSGRSPDGARATESHTGALAGTDGAYQALFEETGVARVDDEVQLIDVVEWLNLGRRLSGSRIGIVTVSGGTGALMADLLHAAGFTVPPLPAEARAAIASRLPPFASAANPVDVTSDYKKDVGCISHTIRHLLAQPDIDAVVILAAPRHWLEAEILAGAGDSEKPVACVWMTPLEMDLQPNEVDPLRLRAAGIPSYSGLQRCVRSLEALRRVRFTRVAPGPQPNPARLACATMQPATLADLEKLGIPAAAQREAADKDAATRAAREIGFPVVVKVNSPDIAHRTDVGGVWLGLCSPEQVADACLEIEKSVRQHAPKARWAGFSVAAHVTPWAEFIVGAVRSAGFPPLVMFGAGGVAVEAGADLLYAFAPLSREGALNLVRRLPFLTYLRERRRLPVDEEELARIVQAVGDLMAADDSLQEFEINPLALTAGGRFCALDVLFVRSGQGREGVNPGGHTVRTSG